jgi:hypothetical protein
MTKGLPAPEGEKRTKPATVHLYPSLAKAVEQLAEHEDRSVSTFVQRVLERDPLVKTVLQQITASGGN